MITDKYKGLATTLAKTKAAVSGSNAVVELAQKLFHSRDVIHLAHLKTTSYAAHNALGDFYDGILGFADELIETAQGCEQKLMNVEIPSAKYEEPLPYLLKLKEEVISMRDKMEYEFQKNITDEITALIAKTCYKLKFLK